jgi:capsular polysaccharide biosynthesis protein
VPEIEVYDFGKLSPAEQLSLCAETAMLLGPHGAGFSNIAFCSPGTVQVELFPSLPIEPLYSRLAHVAGARAYWAEVDFSAPALPERTVSALRALIAQTRIGQGPVL